MKRNENYKEESTIVHEFGRRGIILSTQDGKINFNSSRTPLSQDDRDILIGHKADLISYLEYLASRCRSYIDGYKTADGQSTASFQQDGYGKFYVDGDLSKMKPNIFIKILSARPLSKEADENIVEQAINELCVQVDTLRSDLFVESGRIYQLIDDYKKVEILRFHINDPDADATVFDKMLSDISERSVYPLFNAAIVYGHSGSRCLVVLVSHLVFDVWSRTILEHKVEDIYDSLVNNAELKPAAIQYSEYAKEQKDFEAVFRDIKYWSHNLSGARPPKLPMSHSDRTPGTFTYADHFIGNEDVSRLSEISKSQATTLSVGILTLFAAALRIWSGDDDLIINTTYHGRNHEKYYHTMGLFAGRVPVRLKVKEESSISELLGDVIEAQTSAWSYSVMPTQGILEILEIPSGINKIVFNSAVEIGGGIGERPGPSLYGEGDDVEAGALCRAIQSAHFHSPRLPPTDIELIFHLSRQPDGISVKIGHSSRFDRRDIERLIDIAKAVSTAMISTPGAKIGDLAKA